MKIKCLLESGETERQRLREEKAELLRNSRNPSQGIPDGGSADPDGDSEARWDDY